MFSLLTNTGLPIYLVRIYQLTFPVVEKKYKIRYMACLSKCHSKSFTLCTSPITSVHLKKVENGPEKSHVKYFATDIHRNYGYERFTQSINPIHYHRLKASAME